MDRLRFSCGLYNVAYHARLCAEALHRAHLGLNSQFYPRMGTKCRVAGRRGKAEYEGGQLGFVFFLNMRHGYGHGHENESWERTFAF